MKREIVITDLTRMAERRVCIAGYDYHDWTCIRPVLPPPGISENALLDSGQRAIYPFAVLTMDFVRHTPDPPHTEDWVFNPYTYRFIRELPHHDRRKVLERTSFPDIESIFEVPILTGPGFYVKDGVGPRSLGTIQPIRIN